MDREILKKELGDGLCECCPWKNGEISRRCDAICEGSYCNNALDNFLDENENYFDETENE